MNQHALAAWSIASGNDLLLDTSGVGFSVGEMSGVTYLGNSPAAGKFRFLAVQDNGDGLITFDAAFDLSGNLVSAEAVSNRRSKYSRITKGSPKLVLLFFLARKTVLVSVKWSSQLAASCKI
ncbi:MAG: hypothetical protein GXP24_13550 [Planctomycetes bacterium]|nr:hypothetical protein [Planctomycetota bacterium]